jgi:hypothetical protein
MKGPRRALVVAILASVAILAGCGRDDEGEGTPAESGSLTIVTDIDFTSEPFKGTFEVTDGSDELGCSGGTFVDQNVGEEDVDKVLTCMDGERSGSFTILFHPTPEESDVSGWEFVRATGDFTGLEGEGDFSVDYGDDEDSGVETFTGDVNLG